MVCVLLEDSNFYRKVTDKYSFARNTSTVHMLIWYMSRYQLKGTRGKAISLLNSILKHAEDHNTAGWLVRQHMHIHNTVKYRSVETE